VENFTAAEYHNGKWFLYYHHEQAEELQPDELEIPKESQLYQVISKKFACLNLI